MTTPHTHPPNPRLAHDLDDASDVPLVAKLRDPATADFQDVVVAYPGPSQSLVSLGSRAGLPAVALNCMQDLPSVLDCSIPPLPIPAVTP